LSRAWCHTLSNIACDSANGSAPPRIAHSHSSGLLFRQALICGKYLSTHFSASLSSKRRSSLRSSSGSQSVSPAGLVMLGLLTVCLNDTEPTLLFGIQFEMRFANAAARLVAAS